MILLDETSLTFLQKAEAISTIFEAAITTLAIIIGGYWTYYRFIRQRENHPIIEFSADIIFHSKKNNDWIIELVAFIENKGKVQHKIYNLDFDLYSIENYDSTTYHTEFGGQLYFPHELKKGSFLRKDSKYFFIEPGTKSKYSFVTTVPVKSNAVIFHTWFSYKDGIHGHTAEATKKVPDELKNI